VKREYAGITGRMRTYCKKMLDLEEVVTTEFKIGIRIEIMELVKKSEGRKSNFR